MTEEENKKFNNSHRRAMVTYCRRNGIDINLIHASYEDDSTVTYDLNGEVFMTARAVTEIHTKIEYHG